MKISPGINSPQIEPTYREVSHYLSRHPMYPLRDTEKMFRAITIINNLLRKKFNEFTYITVNQVSERWAGDAHLHINTHFLSDYKDDIYVIKNTI